MAISGQIWSFLSKKSEFFYKMDPVFFIKSAKNGSFFINTNILINGRIYTPDIKPTKPNILN